ncbi:hypothetical protein E2C01_100664 [Portunus trituberculatus]|uniref:Uncharacterized protein n=1 Tax=Portunus trituberculatus TaxID=210409 RepID=A0A5B7KCT0_PORTR|nr:hypothetical protein [Portunus trituberculatus]
MAVLDLRDLKEKQEYRDPLDHRDIQASFPVKSKQVFHHINSALIHVILGMAVNASRTITVMKSGMVWAEKGDTNDLERILTLRRIYHLVVLTLEVSLCFSCLSVPGCGHHLITLKNCEDGRGMMVPI